MAIGVVGVIALQAITTAGGELVRITSPKDGQEVKGRIRVQAQTQIEDAAYLIFCVDRSRPHATNVEPHFYDLDTTQLTDGPHALAVEAYARQGLVARSSAVTVRVANTAAPPPPVAVVELKPAASPERPAEIGAILQIAAAAAESKESAAQPRPQQASAPVLILGPMLTAAQPTASEPAGVAAATSAPTARAESAAAAPAHVAPAPRAATKAPVLQVRSKGAAPPRVTVILDGSELAFDVSPAVRDGRAFGPLRAVMEQSGGVVTWLGTAKQAVTRRAGMELRVTIGSAQARLNDGAIDLGAPASLVNGRTIVPLRAACQPQGFKVMWVPDSRTVRICTADAPVRIGMLTAR